MTIPAAILALIKAFPLALKVFSQVIDLYFGQQEAADSSHYSKKKIKRDALLFAMTKPGITDEEIKNIRRALYDLGSG